MAHGQAAYRVDHNNLRELRQLGGFTLRAFCEACEETGQSVSAGQISRIERGEHQPRPALLKAMAKVLKVSPRDLLQQPDEDDETDGVAA